jgi:hypothetical protein
LRRRVVTETYKSVRILLGPDRLPGEMRVTITFLTVMRGTEIEIVQEGLPAAILVEFCDLGWQESVAALAHLVEPEISDGP